MSASTCTHGLLATFLHIPKQGNLILWFLNNIIIKFALCHKLYIVINRDVKCEVTHFIDTVSFTGKAMGLVLY